MSRRHQLEEDVGLGVAPQLQKMVLGHTFAERQCSSQEVHKDGIGCGLAKDEGSQGDQKDSITDQCPPAVGQRTRVSVIFFHVSVDSYL